MTKIVNENPWIVALVVVIVGLPISIILYMLCSSSSPKKVDIARLSYDAANLKLFFIFRALKILKRLMIT